MYVPSSGCRWSECPGAYGPHTTTHNRFARWARRGIWEFLFQELVGNELLTDTQMSVSNARQSARLRPRAESDGQKQVIGRSRRYVGARFRGNDRAIVLACGDLHRSAKDDPLPKWS